jgi:hypothetical protein
MTSHSFDRIKIPDVWWAAFRQLGIEAYDV